MAEDSTHTAVAWTVIATNSVTIDLTTHAQGVSPDIRMGQLCRSIVVTKAGTGTLVLKKKNGTSETLTGVISGQELPGQVKKILPASAFSELVVYW